MSVPTRFSLRLPPTARSAARGRRFVVDVLQRWHLDELVDAAALLSSEIITNAVLHARTPVTIAIERVNDGCVQIEVSDGSTFFPQRRHPTADSTNGRGVDLLDRLAAAWTVRSSPGGKTVQFTLDSSRDRWAGFVGADWAVDEL